MKHDLTFIYEHFNFQSIVRFNISPKKISKMSSTHRFKRKKIQKLVMNIVCIEYYFDFNSVGASN